MKTCEYCGEILTSENAYSDTDYLAVCLDCSITEGIGGD